MALQLFNTLSRRVEEFIPLIPGKVGFYACGPTVYNYAHIGNLRTYIFNDILHRVLEYNGFNVRHVMNITDVGHMTSDADEGEDKVEKEAHQAGKDPWEIADLYTRAFFDDTRQLNILRPHVTCKATEHIPEMTALVENLLEKGYAYQVHSGIYFDISKFEGYGRLSRLDMAGRAAGARVEVNPEKHHPADFALWVLNRPNHIMQWDSPWGRGYPGWHIECSAMSMKYLGETFDLHTGGIDHIPVHHENEIAQAEAATGKPFVRYWVHAEFLQVDSERMGKSLGNFYTLRDLKEQGFDPLAFRYLCLTARYRSSLDFTAQALTSAQKALQGLYGFVRSLQEDHLHGEEGWVEAHKARFREAINDDLNMPQALAVVWEMIHHANRSQQFRVYEALLDFDRVLGLGFEDVRRAGVELPDEVSRLIAEREDARRARDWAQADALRARIGELGYALEDTPDGVRWRTQ